MNYIYWKPVVGCLVALNLKNNIKLNDYTLLRHPYNYPKKKIRFVYINNKNKDVHNLRYMHW